MAISTQTWGIFIHRAALNNLFVDVVMLRNMINETDPMTLDIIRIPRRRPSSYPMRCHPKKFSWIRGVVPKKKICITTTATAINKGEVNLNKRIFKGILMLKRNPNDIIDAIIGTIILFEQTRVTINNGIKTIFTRASILERKLSFWAK